MLGVAVRCSVGCWYGVGVCSAVVYGLVCCEGRWCVAHKVPVEQSQQGIDLLESADMPQRGSQSSSGSAVDKINIIPAHMACMQQPTETMC